MEALSLFKNDKIFWVIKKACEHLFPDDDAKAFALLRKEIRMRNALLSSKEPRDMLIKSMFLTFSKNTFSTIDIVIFNALSNVQIKFAGSFEYLNYFLKVEVRDSEEYFLTLQSDMIYSDCKIECTKILQNQKLPDQVELVPFSKLSKKNQKTFDWNAIEEWNQSTFFF